MLVETKREIGCIALEVGRALILKKDPSNSLEKPKKY
jgi:hypothetical protein